MIARLLVVVGLLVVARPVEASEIPRFDVERSCAAMAIANTGSQVPQETRDRLKNSCVATQQQAYNAVKDEWGDLTDKEQLSCLSSTARTGNYRSMQYCVDAFYGQEAEKRRNSTPQTFKY